MSTNLERRTFPKHAGTGNRCPCGGIRLGGHGFLAGWSGRWAGGIDFFFAALDSAEPVHNPMSPDGLLIQGCCHFDQHSGDIRGSGLSFTTTEASRFHSSRHGHRVLEGTPVQEPRPGTKAWCSVDRHHDGGRRAVWRVAQPGEVIPAQLTVGGNSGAIPSSTLEDERFGDLTFLPLMPTIGISGFDDQSFREVE